MKTIIKRHAIWNRLLAATGQPTTVRTSLLSSRVTYGVAGRAMFDAPLVKNREAARSLARRGQVLGRLGQGHEQRRRWQADSTLMLTILALWPDGVACMCAFEFDLFATHAPTFSPSLQPSPHWPSVPQPARSCEIGDRPA